MKELVFLPDREGRDELSQQHGFVRVGADGASLKTLSDRLVLPPKETPSLNVTMWRGVLTLALLCDAWPESGTKTTVTTVDSTTSLFAAWVLSARPEEERRDALHLAVLERGGERRLLGIADAHMGLRLPATPSDFKGVIPARAAWYEPETDTWSDPVPYLNAHDRAILLARLTMMGLDAPEIAALKADLAEADKPRVEAVESGNEEALRALGLRMQAVCALKDFDAFTVQREPCNVTEDNPLVRVFSGVDVRYTADRESATFLWKGVPFARTSAALGLSGANDPRQEDMLNEIDTEISLLTENSVRWNRMCANAIADWMKAQDNALLPEARAQAEAVRSLHEDKSRQIQTAVTLTWPWDASSGAVRYLLQEALGDAWMAGAANPFSDVLTKLTGHVLGDTALQRNCACADGVLLPPMSREMAMCVANAGDGEGLALDMMRFDPQLDGGITASFLLRGVGEVRMVRSYALNEILVLAEEAAPCVAVWPCLPMDDWHAYHVFAKAGETSISALSGGVWKTLPPAAQDNLQPWQCLHTERYPACLTVEQDGKCLGVLPNMLPVYHPETKGEAQVSLDMGNSATAAAIMLAGEAISAAGEQLTRLLVSPQNMPADDFLLSLTPAELTPSSVALPGDGDELFTDGYVYAVTRFDALRDMVPGTVCTSLKWRADSRSVRARRILMHQVMLGASLNAMIAGADSIRWRLTIADEMGDEGRDALLAMAEDMVHIVAEETGLPLTKGKPGVIWAEEAAALHAYLKGEGGMKGSFAVLDIGGGSTKLHLWMQGRTRPTGGAVIMEGSSTALLSALREDPQLLRDDFADCGNEELISAVEVLCQQLSLAGESAAQADKALLMLDALLDEYKQPVTQHMYARFNAQRPTNLQGILLEMYAAAVFNVGLMLEQAGNDSSISHYFPGDLTICLTGRGSWLIDSLTPQQRSHLQRIGREPMQLRHPVRTLTLRPSPLPALGVALGMAVIKESGVVSDTPVIRTRQSFSELMRMLVTLMFQCYPVHMWSLHPGLFDEWGSLTPAGADTIRRVASGCYGDGEDIPASVMTFMRRLRKAVVAADDLVSPGE